MPNEFAQSERRTHDYVRHGTANLSAAFNVNTAKLPETARQP